MSFLPASHHINNSKHTIQMPLQKRTCHSGNHTTRIHFHLISIQSPKIIGCKNRAIRHTSEKCNITCSQKGIQIHYRRSNIGKYIIKYISIFSIAQPNVYKKKTALKITAGAIQSFLFNSKFNMTKAKCYHA